MSVFRAVAMATNADALLASRDDGRTGGRASSSFLRLLAEFLTSSHVRAARSRVATATGTRSPLALFSWTPLLSLCCGRCGVVSSSGSFAALVPRSSSTLPGAFVVISPSLSPSSGPGPWALASTKREDRRE